MPTVVIINPDNAPSSPAPPAPEYSLAKGAWKAARNLLIVGGVQALGALADPAVVAKAIGDNPLLVALQGIVVFLATLGLNWLKLRAQANAQASAQASAQVKQQSGQENGQESGFGSTPAR